MKFMYKKWILKFMAFIMCCTMVIMPIYAAETQDSDLHIPTLKNDMLVSKISNQPSPWAAEEMERAIEKGLVPEWLQSDYAKPITRKELAELLSYYLLYKREDAANLPTLWISLSTESDVLYKENVFSDINDINLNWMYQLGYIKGYEDGTFRPDNNITRQEAAVMMHNAMWRYSNYGHSMLSMYYTENEFKDFYDIASWAYQAVVFLFSHGGVNGVEKGIFGPYYNITREQAISIILRTIEKEF